MTSNLFNFDNVEEHKDVTVMKCNLSIGFCWWDEYGERHDEDGFIMPEMQLIKANVQVLTNENGERSAGWECVMGNIT